MKLTIDRQNLIFAYDKNKNILIQSIKNFSDGSKKIHKATIDKKTIASIRACKDYNAVSKILRDANKIADLKLDHTAKDAGIAANTGYCTTRDGLIKFLAMPKIAYQVPKATSKAKTIKAKSKATSKTKSKAKK